MMLESRLCLFAEYEKIVFEGVLSGEELGRAREALTLAVTSYGVLYASNIRSCSVYSPRPNSLVRMERSKEVLQQRSSASCS